MPRKDDKKRYRERRLNGICIMCDDPAEENNRMCKKHKDETNEFQKARRAKRKELGLCNTCKEKALKDKAKCAKCLEHYAKISYEPNRRKILQLYNDGICVSCRERPRIVGYMQCSICRLKGSMNKKLRRESIKYEQEYADTA